MVTGTIWHGRLLWKSGCVCLRRALNATQWVNPVYHKGLEITTTVSAVWFRKCKEWPQAVKPPTMDCTNSWVAQALRGFDFSTLLSCTISLPSSSTSARKASGQKPYHRIQLNRWDPKVLSWAKETFCGLSATHFLFCCSLLKALPKEEETLQSQGETQQSSGQGRTRGCSKMENLPKFSCTQSSLG